MTESRQASCVRRARARLCRVCLYIHMLFHHARIHTREFTATEGGKVKRRDKTECGEGLGREEK
jgi:hypothetical protein